MLRAGHDVRGELARSRCLRGPRRRGLDVVVEGAPKPDRTQDLRQDVDVDAVWGWRGALRPCCGGRGERTVIHERAPWTHTSLRTAARQPNALSDDRTCVPVSQSFPW